MDNLTHTLFGAALGEAGLKRRTPLALPVLLIGANLPDIDIVAAFAGHSLSFRRGWTHGVLALVVLPILLTGVMLAWDRWIRRRRRPDAPPARWSRLLPVATLAVLSHPFLDWLNTYGLRWLMPFDGTWFYGDALFIIDPWLWIVLMLGVFAAARRSSRRIGSATIAVSLLYIVAMLGTAASARGVVEREARAAGLQPQRVMVGPIFLDPTRRQVIVDAGDNYHTGTFSWRPSEGLRLDPSPVFRGADHPAALAAAETPSVRRFLGWSRFPFFVVSDEGADWLVRVDDLRYSARARGSFASTSVRLPKARVAATGSGATAETRDVNLP